MANVDNVDSVESRLLESEDKLNKFKALAVKLKKELLETKEQLAKSNSECNELKASKSQNQDRDKISASYQQVVRNFQSLQNEYDKLQDESDCLKKSNKQLDSDLSNTVSELTKVREELAECRLELDTERNSVISLTEEKQSIESKKTEIESKLIILQNDLEIERKRNAANTGLEHTISELHNQLDIKTTEIVDLIDQLENAKEDSQKYYSLFKVNEEINLELQCLKDDNTGYKQKIQELSEQLETKISELEHYKLNCSESSAKILHLESKLSLTSENQLKSIKSLESEVSELKEKLSITEEEILKKKEEFDAYKLRVTRVLKQQQNEPQNNFQDAKQVENLENTVANMTEELNNLKKKFDIVIKEREVLHSNYSQLNNSHNILKNEFYDYESLKKRFEEFKSENDKLKSLAREMQSTIVNERLESEKYYKNKIEELEKSHQLVLSNLEKELQEVNIELNNLRAESEKYSIHTNGLEMLHKSRQSLNTLDELESVETASIPLKRLSISSNSIGGNILDEILNSTDNHDNKSAQDFTLHLTIAQNKVENLTQLLEESESSSLLLTEQNRVLKEEIRRLQRSVDRLEMVENLEYLKNIIVKYITLNGGDEKQQLIPVIATILKLSPAEQNLFQSVASNDQNSSNNRWSDYLYQWSGGVK